MSRINVADEMKQQLSGERACRAERGVCVKAGAQLAFRPLRRPMHLGGEGAC